MNQLSVTETFKELEKISQSDDVRHLFTDAAAVTISQEIQLAQAMDRMRQLVTKPVIEKISALQNTTLGFLTDKPTGYDWHVLRDVIIEAILRGFKLTGNEFNVISGRFYPTKNGLYRRCRDFPGMANLELDPGVPEIKGDTATVKMRASWLLHGEKMQLHQDIPVRINKGMGVDAAIGKAKRKTYERILEKISGQIFDTGDTDDPPQDVLEQINAGEQLERDAEELFDKSPNAAEV